MKQRCRLTCGPQISRYGDAAAAQTELLWPTAAGQDFSGEQLKSESEGDARARHLDASADKISEFGALLEFKNNFSAKLADELQT